MMGSELAEKWVTVKKWKYCESDSNKPLYGAYCVLSIVSVLHTLTHLILKFLKILNIDETILCMTQWLNFNMLWNAYHIKCR